MKLRRRLRAVFEAVLILVAYGTIPFLPRRIVVALSRGAGGLGYFCSRSARRIALANLDLAFGDERSAEEKQRTALASFQSSALVFLDLLWFSAFSRQRVRKYVQLDDSVLPTLEVTPLLAVTAHIGNWEVFGQALSLHGAPLLSVVAPVKSPVVDWIVTRARGRTGQSIVRRKGAGRAMLRELKRGGRTAILIDQNTLPLRGGEFVNFFGLPVPVTKAVGVLAKRSKSIIIVGACVPDARGHYTAYGMPPFCPVEEGLEEAAVTQRVTDLIQEFITRYPENWLWSYKRWKFVPPGVDRTPYPFYSQQKPVYLKERATAEVSET